MRRIFLVFIMFFITNIATAHSLSLSDRITTIISSLGANASIGIDLVSLNTGRTLYTHHAEMPLVPASNLKILTADAALIYLGPQYVFKTKIYQQGNNLYIVFSGDPSFSVPKLNKLFLRLKALGIRVIHGNVYMDNTAYDRDVRGLGWNEGDYHFCYSAPIAAGIINHNCALPHLASANVNGAAQSFSSVSNVWKHQAAIVRYLIKRNGMTLVGNIMAGKLPQGPVKLLATDRSAPLFQLVKVMLKKSDNIYAESVFKKIGQVYTKTPGSWANGEKAVKAILAEHNHMDLSDVRIVDGSGLSHENRISTSTMVRILQQETKHYASWKYFYMALPISSRDGTLKHRLKSIVGKVHAKTGTIRGVSSLSGYVETRRFGLVAFSIIINNVNGAANYRAYEDDIVKAVALM